MVKKEVVLCDICGNRVGMSKCNLCSKDICNFRSCIRKFPISIGGNKNSYDSTIYGGKTIDILYCRTCWDEKIKGLINTKDFGDEDVIEKTAKSIGECIRKRLIIENL